MVAEDDWLERLWLSCSLTVDQAGRNLINNVKEWFNMDETETQRDPHELDLYLEKAMAAIDGLLSVTHPGDRATAAMLLQGLVEKIMNGTIGLGAMAPKPALFYLGTDEKLYRVDDNGLPDSERELQLANSLTQVAQMNFAAKKFEGFSGPRLTVSHPTESMPWLNKCIDEGNWPPNQRI